MAQGRGHFDHIFITDRDLQDEWASATGSAIHWAPWGTDTLAIKELPAERPVDLLRVGRQPAAWDDDRRTEEAASAVGLTFEGRPAMDPDPEVNQQNVRSALLRSKFVLAFSNLVSPAGIHASDEGLRHRALDRCARRRRNRRGGRAESRRSDARSSEHDRDRSRGPLPRARANP